MDTFIKNYWSLYLDFLDDFQEVTYKGFSIPYLCTFISLVNKSEKLWNDLHFEAFTQTITNDIKSQKEIQAKFNTFIQNHEKKPFVKNNNGKIVIYDNKLLRFSRKVLIDYFDPTKTIRLTEGKKKQKVQQHTKNQTKKRKKIRISTDTHIIRKKKKNNQSIKTKNVNSIPVRHFSHYTTRTTSAVQHVQKKAQTIIDAYKQHPLYLDQAFQSTLFAQIEQIINRIEESQNFLVDESVSCIIVSTTHPSSIRTLVLVAAEKGIPTICMQHGIIASELGYIPKIATIDAVYGRFEKDWYESLGARKDSIEIIGHPRFDQAFSKTAAMSRKKLEGQLGLDPNKKTLLVVVREDKGIEKWRTFIKHLSKKRHFNILIKDYPGKTGNALAREFPFIHFTYKENLYDLLFHVDCVACYASTVGLEAMLADKPAFILNEDFPGYTGYYNHLDDMVQADPHTLAELIIDYFHDPNWKPYAKSKREKFLTHAYSTFQWSGKRLKSIINRLTN